MKIGKQKGKNRQLRALVKRESGPSSKPEEYGTRELPEPTVVSAFAAIESKAEFQERCQKERRRLGVGLCAALYSDQWKQCWNSTHVLHTPMITGRT